MNPNQLTDVLLLTVYATAELSLPLLLTALVVGLIISVFQAATQVNEATLSFLPKVAAIVAVLIFASPWMMRKMRTFTTQIYEKIPQVTRVVE